MDVELSAVDSDSTLNLLESILSFGEPLTRVPRPGWSLKKKIVAAAVSVTAIISVIVIAAATWTLRSNANYFARYHTYDEVG